MGCSYDVCSTELDLELYVARTKVLALIQKWTTSGRSKASGSAQKSHHGLLVVRTGMNAKLPSDEFCEV